MSERDPASHPGRYWSIEHCAWVPCPAARSGGATSEASVPEPRRSAVSDPALGERRPQPQP